MATHANYARRLPWLEKKIDFPGWTKQSIHSMTEIKISAWAEKTGVALDKQYATEERESGTMALEDGVPGYSPEILGALPRAEWELKKNKMSLKT
jgi:hypothetical protein